MEIAKKIFSKLLNIATILSVVVLFVAIYSFFQIKILNKDYVNLFGYTFLQVKTGSMENAIQVGDIVIVKVLAKDDKIAQNDIITYKEDGFLITHRVIEISNDTVITKGDANNTTDKPINKNQIVGKVKKIIPNVRIWIEVLKNKSVYTLIIITIVLVIITSSIKTEDKNTIDEKELGERIKDRGNIDENNVEESNEEKD